MQGKPAPFSVSVHPLYNPESITQYNVVPGLMGVVLTLTMVMMTGLAITRERERGTMENLLAMPATPMEVMTGKLIPYIGIGLIQASIILLAARYVFQVPFFGSVGAVYLSALLFIAANLTVGITLSSLAQNQLQAVQLAVFYFLPNILLSGFMFPFKGMPGWAQAIGNLLPLTYFNRLIRGILLKGNGWADSWPSVWPMLVFTLRSWGCCGHVSQNAGLRCDAMRRSKNSNRRVATGRMTGRWLLALGCTVGPRYHAPAAAGGHRLHSAAAAGENREQRRDSRESAAVRFVTRNPRAMVDSVSFTRTRRHGAGGVWPTARRLPRPRRD